MRTTGAVCVVLLAGSVASGDFVQLDTQDRHVSVETMADDGGGAMTASLDEAAEDFGPFDMFIQASTPLNGAASFGTADQSSTIDILSESFVIDGSGLGFSSVAVNHPSSPGGTNVAESSSASSLSVGFELLTEGVVTLEGVLSVDLSGIGDLALAEIAFVNTDTDEILFSALLEVDDNPGGNTELPFSLDGLSVPAGNYSLSASASAEAGAAISGLDDDVLSAIGSSEATFDFTFSVVPSPGTITLLGLGGLIGLRPRRS